MGTPKQPAEYPRQEALPRRRLRQHHVLEGDAARPILVLSRIGFEQIDQLEHAQIITFGKVVPAQVSLLMLHQKSGLGPYRLDVGQTIHAYNDKGGRRFPVAGAPPLRWPPTWLPFRHPESDSPISFFLLP